MHTNSITAGGSGDTRTDPGPRTAVTTVHDDLVAELRSRVAGDVHAPGDAGYDTARLGWNRTTDHRPVAIVVAADVHDVSVTLEAASIHGVGVGVQATGHGAVVAVDGVLLVTNRLDDVTVDPHTRMARVGAGATWAPVLAAAQQHGLAPLLGSSPTVGAVGYTLGGGLGWMARRWGPACDSVRSFEVATPDGRVVTATSTERPELYTVLRGGGGGAVGVVTSMEIDLFEVSDVYAGNLYYPAEAAVDVAEAYLRWIADAPDDLTSSIVMINYPPLPDVPAALRGRSFAVVRGCWVGPVGAGAAFVDRLRAAVAPVIDMWGPMPFGESAAISHDPVDPLPCVNTGGWFDRFDADAARLIAAAAFPDDGPPVLLMSEVRHLGGAVATNDRERSVMGHRDGQFMLSAVGVPFAAGDGATIAARLESLKVALGGHLSDRISLNFVDGPDRRRRTADGLDAETHQLVADVHHRFDPDGCLRYGVMPPC